MNVEFDFISFLHIDFMTSKVDRKKFKKLVVFVSTNYNKSLIPSQFQDSMVLNQSFPLNLSISTQKLSFDSDFVPLLDNLFQYGNTLLIKNISLVVTVALKSFLNSAEQLSLSLNVIKLIQLEDNSFSYLNNLSQSQLTLKYLCFYRHN